MRIAAKSNVLLTVMIAFLLVANAHAGVTLWAARIGAADVTALAKFYQSVFGMKEVNRLDAPGIKEIMLNFGDTVETAKANKAPWIVIMQRPSNDVKDVPHLVLIVPTLKATIAAFKAGGGTVNGEPMKVGDAGMLMVMASDPAGNGLELVEYSNALDR